MYLKIAVTAIALSAASCSYIPPVPMDSSQHANMKDKTFSVVVHKDINARIQTMGKTGLFGPLAGPYFASEGARVIREDKIPDPALATSAQIASELTKRFQMKQVGTPGKIYSGPEPLSGIEADEAAILKDYPEGDYVLDSDSLEWWMMYNVIDGYNVIYRSYNRLIERSTGKVVAARPCGFSANQDEDDHPSYDELLANHSEKLKQYLAKASVKCSTEFMEQFDPKKS